MEKNLNNQSSIVVERIITVVAATGVNGVTERTGVAGNKEKGGVPGVKGVVEVVSYRKYNKGKFLGKGGFAECYEFCGVDNKVVNAAKIITKSSLAKSRAKEKLITEIQIHQSLHCTHIVGFDHYFEDDENVYLLLELCSNGSLADFLKNRDRLTEQELQKYLIPLIKAVVYLHKHQIIHRDLKTSNVFLNHRNEIKLGDFGLSVKLETNDEIRYTNCGTINYMPPEMVDGKKIGHSYEVDVWALGVIFYTLLTGKQPFEAKGEIKTYEKIMTNSYTVPKDSSISSNAILLLNDIFQINPKKRINIFDILNHRYFSNFVYEPSLSKSKNDLEVKTWLDFRDKYGLGWILSSNVYGIIFNDNKIAYLERNSNNFTYIEPGSSNINKVISNHLLTDYPVKLKKTVKLIELFRDYFEEKLSFVNNDSSSLYSNKNNIQEEVPLIYVSKYIKTKYSDLFEFGQFVQIIFKDSSVIQLDYQKKIAIYRSKKGERSSYKLESKNYFNNEFNKRMSYLNKILTIDSDIENEIYDDPLKDDK